MWASIIAAFLVSCVVGSIYFLGYTQGRHVEKAHSREEKRKLMWMVRESLRRYGSWTKSEADLYAGLASDYKVRKNIAENDDSYIDSSGADDIRNLKCNEVE